MIDWLHSPKKLLLLTLGIALAVIGSALASQYLGGLEPCKLCYWQRNPYYIGIPVILLAFFLFNTSVSLRKILLLIITVIFLAGVGLGIYHVGVEQGWWLGPASCSSAASLGETLEQQIENLLNKPRIDCGEPAFVLLGISMAGYNAICSLLLAALSLRAFLKSKD